MNKPTKAILLSALVLPGAGHFYLKRYWIGTALMAVICIAIYLIFRDVMFIANNVAEQIVAGNIGTDFGSILGAVEKQRARSGNAASFAWVLIIGCWFIALIDCIRIAIGARSVATSRDAT